MTAEGELYLDEECRDYFEEDLNKIFGEGWRIKANDFCNCWDISQIPKFCKVEIVNIETNKVLGFIEIENIFKIEEDNFNFRTITPEPKTFKVLKN